MDILFIGGLTVIAVLALCVFHLKMIVRVERGHVIAMQRRGIYIVACSQDNATYVGSTKVNFHARWGQHIAILNKGKHHNPRLQAAWDQYGASAFTFHVLELIEDESKIETREREILEHRAMRIPPIHNYNVNNSRVYAVANMAELDLSPTAPVVTTRKSRYYAPHAITEIGRAQFIELGLSEDEIAAMTGSSSDKTDILGEIAQ